MQLQPQGLKVIHWEFNQDALKILEFADDPTFRAVVLNDPDTKEKNGLCLVWNMKLYTPVGLCYHCLAEDVYLINDIEHVNAGDIQELLNGSCKKLGVEILSRTKSVGLGNLQPLGEGEIEGILRRMKS